MNPCQSKSSMNIYHMFLTNSIPIEFLLGFCLLKISQTKARPKRISGGVVSCVVRFMCSFRHWWRRTSQRSIGTS